MERRPEAQMGVRLDITLDTWIKAAAGIAAGLWAQTSPLVQLLMLLMVLDYATGILAAIYNREIHSGIAFRGVLRKAIILLLVVTGMVLQSHADLPIADLIAGFYGANEGMSIVENAARAGLPVPDAIRSVLLKLNPNADVHPRVRTDHD